MGGAIKINENVYVSLKQKCILLIKKERSLDKSCE